MLLDKTTASEYATAYAQLVKKEFNPRLIMLYGSFAKGNWNENSDIDIAVIVDNINENFLDISKKLNKLTRSIDNRIEPVLLQLSDDKSGFLTSILNTGIILYNN
jgi:predicted nucleotidyltransferase